MLDPLAVLETNQAQIAQKAADEKEFEEEKQRKAVELFAPVREAFDKLKAAGVEWNYDAYSWRTLDQCYMTWPGADDHVSWYRLHTYGGEITLAIQKPGKGSSVWPDQPFRYGNQGRYPFTHSKEAFFGTADELMRYFLTEHATMLRVPKPKAAADAKAS